MVMNFIDNNWIAGGGHELISVNPATGETVWQGFAATREQTAQAVEAARRAFENWQAIPFDRRCRVIRAFGEKLRENVSDLAKIISIETGKPLWESTSEVESMLAKIDISVTAYHERTGMRRSETAGIRSNVRHKPHGVVAVFGPFNFPGHLPNGHIIPALLAGNAVVFKPSEHTPLTAQHILGIWQSANLPDGVLNLVQGTGETGRDLAGQKDIDGLFFTGSTQTGKALHAQFAGDPRKILALEMGGNNPLIISGHAHNAAAVYVTILSAYLSAGQRCTCARRVFVPDTVAGDAFIVALIAAIRKIVVGRFDAVHEPFMGSVISDAAADELLNVQGGLAEKGGEILVPMERLERGTGLISPGLMDVTAVRNLPDKEYFGPFLQLIRYHHLEHAIDMANDTRFGLSAGLLSEDEQEYDFFWARIRAGIVNWNRPLTGASSAAPFGGIGDSGNHRPGAFSAADYCAYPVSSLESSALVLPDTLYPGITL